MRGVRVLAALALVAAVVVVGATAASAHDVLRSATPAAGATVDRLPSELVLTFDQPALAVGTQITVTGPSGPVQQGTPTLIDADVRQPLGGGPPGAYTVVWRVTSADGHPVSGTFAFTTTSASTSSAGPSATTAASPAAVSAPATSPPWGVIALVAVVLVIAASVLVVRRRR